MRYSERFLICWGEGAAVRDKKTANWKLQLTTLSTAKKLKNKKNKNETGDNLRVG
jgi:hypothetical protein